MSLPGYVIACSVYAALGVCTAWVFRSSRTIREHPWCQFSALLMSFLAAIPALVVSSRELYMEFQLGFQGFLFLASALCHVPVWIYIAVFHSGRLAGIFFPAFTARKSAELPLIFWWFNAEPAFSRTRTVVARPENAANKKAVLPNRSRALIDAPCLR